MDLGARFAPFFPIGDRLVRLEVAEPWGEPHEDPDHGVVTMNLIVYDEGPDGLSIRDIKQQELYCGPTALYDDRTRVDEMLYAQQEVLGEALRGPVETFECLMPHELFFTDVLKLVRARMREDFARALRTKGRLGKYLAR